MTSFLWFTLLYSLLLLCFSGNAATGTTSFRFQNFAFTTFKSLGEAHVFNNTIRLTPDLLVPNTRAGMVLYDKPVRFRQPGNATLASFTTTFSFSIANLNPNSIGGGLAFVISPNDEAIGDAGGHLGVPTGAIAVEFDTSMDGEFKDVNGNHVGLDLGSMVSSYVKDLHSIKVNLRSGEQVNVWIDYSGLSNQLNISISYSNKKPKSPVLSITVGLNKYVKEFMFVGFSASTQGSTEVHSLQKWSFNSSFDAKPEPNSPPPTTTVTLPLPPPTSPIEKQSKGNYVVSKIIVGVASAAVVAAIGGGLYCIRSCYCGNECNVNNPSINCCICGRRRRRTMDSQVSSGSPIRKNAAAV
ncbi:hypothetical protein OSB04_009528 [Centaurea solstitialis]|uniref:Legume lectin domain-containing protein n=1 Tax=Centaurea solstitialis TaxID=347529 RepID=A0AA38WM80_9ASTR|nr:hypothetical protein OSB04_009528 [Centaurea solstitialis]